MRRKIIEKFVYSMCTTSRDMASKSLVSATALLDTQGHFSSTFDSYSKVVVYSNTSFTRICLIIGIYKANL